MDSTGTIKLDGFKFIPFYTALKNNDYKLLGVSEDDFWILTDEFWKLSKNKLNAIEDQLEKISVKVTLLRACMGFLIKRYDKEMADIVRNLDVAFFEDDMEGSLLRIPEKIKELEKLYKIIATQKPPTPKEAETLSAYDILATLSVNLEFGLQFEKITVLEYLSYSRAVKNKIESLKQK